MQIQEIILKDSNKPNGRDKPAPDGPVKVLPASGELASSFAIVKNSNQFHISFNIPEAFLNRRFDLEVRGGDVFLRLSTKGHIVRYVGGRSESHTGIVNFGVEREIGIVGLGKVTRRTAVNFFNGNSIRYPDLVPILRNLVHIPVVKPKPQETLSTPLDTPTGDKNLERDLEAAIFDANILAGELGAELMIEDGKLFATVVTVKRLGS